MTTKTFNLQNQVFEAAKFFAMGAAAVVALGAATQSHAAEAKHVSFYSDAFAYGHVNAARTNLRALYPAGVARIETVVDDLQRAGANCSVDGAAGFSCVRHDQLIQQELATPETWTVRINATADGVVSSIDLSQSLGGGR
jgi:hypothetical protein